MKPCILPWINYGTNTFGRTRVCGYSDYDAQWKKMFEDRNCEWPPTTPPKHMIGSKFQKDYLSWLHKLQNTTLDYEWNSEYFNDIRKTFLKNEWPENCKRCKHVEDTGGESKRIHENHMWFDKYKHLIEETNDDGTVNYLPPHIDVRTGTVCNFKCIHCGPGASSRWMEDYDLIKSYGYNYEIADNTWIASDSKFWDELDISQITRYNFLGGESFYNKRHNEFIKKVNESEYAKNVEIMYVTNGSLLTSEKMNDLKNFKKIKLRLSVDVLGIGGEYFRYGLQWNDWLKKCKYINQLSKDYENFDVAFQWTCSNISIFYLIDTYDFLREEFDNIRFIFSNHVTEPYFMSAQNLPTEIKDKVKSDIDNYMFDEHVLKAYPFYVNYMFQKDAWIDHGKVLINYLNDLDKARNISWRKSFERFSKYVG